MYPAPRDSKTHQNQTGIQNIVKQNSTKKYISKICKSKFKLNVRCLPFKSIDHLATGDFPPNPLPQTPWPLDIFPNPFSPSIINWTIVCQWHSSFSITENNQGSFISTCITTYNHLFKNIKTKTMWTGDSRKEIYLYLLFADPLNEFVQSIYSEEFEHYTAL